jgi:hypothetical protein
MAESPLGPSIAALRQQLEQALRQHAQAVEAAHGEAMATARREAMAAADARFEHRMATRRAEEDSRLQRELEAAAAAADRRIEAAVADARAAALAEVPAGGDGEARLERLQLVLGRLAAATSLTDILMMTLEAAQAEAPRAGLVLVQQGRPRPWRATGMPVAEELDGAAASLVDDVIRAGEARQAPDTGAWAGPFVVDGAVVAALYVEEATAAAAALDVLVRQASLCVTALTIRRSVTALRFASRPAAAGESDVESARRFARLIVSEIKLYHEAAVRDGRAHHDLGARLAPEIAKARQAFDRRVSTSLPGREALFQEELVRVLAGGDAALLGGQVP